MYTSFSVDYDRFVDWPARLAVEMPFLEQELRAVRAHRVLDAACGTGRHAIALAQRGYTVAGADLSLGMIERAQANAAAAGVEIQFEAAGFGALQQAFGAGSFDALLCLGNSLPHLLTPAELVAALADFAACLRPGGLVLIQNRNFDAVLSRRERWMGPQAHREGESEWLFLRVYDFEQNGTITFNVITLRREGIGGWTQSVTSTSLRPLRHEALRAALSAAGFGDLTAYGAMNGAAFDPPTSGNLILTAVRE